jgi:rhodanese-related sulfurtransferase
LGKILFGIEKSCSQRDRSSSFGFNLKTIISINWKCKINPFIMKKIITLLISTLFVSAVFAGEYPDVSIKDLQSALESGKVAVIDVNGAKSFKKGHIPTAIEFGSNAKKLAELLPKDKNTLIVAYCGGPGCSAYKRGAAAAEKLGYKNIKHLSAGISGWKKAGGDLAKK